MVFICMPPFLKSVEFYTSTVTKPQEAFYIICAAVSQDGLIGKAAVKAIEMAGRCPPYLFTARVLFSQSVNSDSFVKKIEPQRSGQIR
jgi:hypothetical protein